VSGETFHVYRCPECGRIADGWKQGPRFCAGSQWLMETPLAPNQGDHPSVEMERLLLRVVSDAV
jgi:hypothetical protein